jgi:D-alanyl-D-alanine carboxypeptidase (penicillin-binding protein 5/6)
MAGQSRGRATENVSPTTEAWITINAATGVVLASQEPDRPGAPASMTKMMLALLVMEMVRDGQLKLTDPVLTSPLASKMGGSQVFLKSGESFPVEDMMAALLIGSANDAAVALAERGAAAWRGRCAG